jgi:hypothetical protein
MRQALLNNPFFRPPAEADRLIPQAGQDGPYDHCAFGAGGNGWMGRSISSATPGRI